MKRTFSLILFAATAPAAFAQRYAELAAVGMPRCSLLIGPASSSILSSSGGRALWPFTVPNAPGLPGLEVFDQGFAPDRIFPS